MRRTVVAAVALVTLTLTGCAAQPSTPTATRSPSPVPTGDNVAVRQSDFIDYARAITFGSQTFTASTNPQILALGAAACELLRVSKSADQTMQIMMDDSNSMPTLEQVAGLLSASVTYLCPQLSPLLP